MMDRGLCETCRISCQNKFVKLVHLVGLVLLESCLQTCMTYTITECTVNKLLMMDRGLCETCRISCQNKFVKLVHLVGFIIKKFVTMHGHMKVKILNKFAVLAHVIFHITLFITPVFIKKVTSLILLSWMLFGLSALE